MITITPTSADKFLIHRADDDKYLGDVGNNIPSPGWRFYPSHDLDSLTEVELTRITRLVRRQSRISTTRAALAPQTK